MPAHIHLLKLCVGAESVEDLAAWQAARIAERRAEGGAGHALHVTRMWPRRADALVGGGSLYWVIKGLVLCRQAVLGLEPRLGADGIQRCAIALASEIVRTTPQPRRPFQGWRYLEPDDAPADLARGAVAEGVPPALLAELADLGVL